jgi:hypothetical protein
LKAYCTLSVGKTSTVTRKPRGGIATPGTLGKMSFLMTN